MRSSARKKVKGKYEAVGSGVARSQLVLIANNRAELALPIRRAKMQLQKIPAGVYENDRRVLRVVFHVWISSVFAGESWNADRRSSC
jgi:hypothetical protein